MIIVKTPQEIKIMAEGGVKLAKIRSELAKMVTPGVTPLEIEQKAQELIKTHGGEPSFQMVKNYHWATCININDGVVHGVPTSIPFKEGDLVSIDVGMLYKGLHTDTSVTVPALPAGGPSGKIDNRLDKFLEVGKIALASAINNAKPGNKVSDIAKSVQIEVEKHGYSPVRALTGHGIGKKLHEDPQIPCFWEKGMQDSVLPEGAVLAIEVIYTMGEPDLALSEDNWTLRTKDGTIAGLFEETVAVVPDGPLVLTTFM